ncbi:hypothetical protein PFLUV_G00171920 [Perca fluviatilis]|uniref:Uncharacterized protein n=1 Tax=Perca fluviatilis TaxID=8168 RepID=A0A6A5ETT5_PERFL|nr:hypothetical protein PFLUV_G00171920 [Perca fluviatilis]
MNRLNDHQEPQEEDRFLVLLLQMYPPSESASAFLMMMMMMVRSWIGNLKGRNGWRSTLQQHSCLCRSVSLTVWL